MNNDDVLTEVINLVQCRPKSKPKGHPKQRMNGGIELAKKILSCSLCDIPFNYLGLPIGSNMKSIASWKTLVDRFHMRLSSWKANLLSIEGRMSLIKSAW
ncbi:hypothetical protein Tco_0103864 [Tanacetum coccineum]